MLVAVAAAVGWFAWTKLRAPAVEDGLASGNGRIEATEVDIATNLAGRLDELLVAEGEFVKAVPPLARMLDSTLVAQRAAGTKSSSRSPATSSTGFPNELLHASVPRITRAPTLSDPESLVRFQRFRFTRYSDGLQRWRRRKTRLKKEICVKPQPSAMSSTLRSVLQSSRHAAWRRRRLRNSLKVRPEYFSNWRAKVGRLRRMRPKA